LGIAQKILSFLFEASCDMQIIAESSIDKNGLKRNLDAQLDGNLKLQRLFPITDHCLMPLLPFVLTNDSIEHY